MIPSPRIHDVLGVLKLHVWHKGEDLIIPLSKSECINLAEDCVAAFARRTRQMEKTETPQDTENT